MGVSIIIPVYNRAKILKESLRSILLQDHEDFEVIVVDDHSDEDIKGVCDSFKDERILYIKNTRLKGAQGARNTGILTSKYDILVFLDSDDHLTNNSISSRLDFLCKESEKKIGLIYGDLLNRKKYPTVKNAYKFMSRNLTLCSFSAMMIPKYVIEEIGLLPENLQSYQDDFLCFEISKKFNFIKCNQVVAKYAPIYRDSNISKNLDNQINGLSTYLEHLHENLKVRYPKYYLFKTKLWVQKKQHSNVKTINSLILKMIQILESRIFK